MRYLLSIITFLILSTSTEAASLRHKKEKLYEDSPVRRLHKNGKKIVAEVTGTLAVGIAKDAIENAKRRRNKEYSAPYPN